MATYLVDTIVTKLRDRLPLRNSVIGNSVFHIVDPEWIDWQNYKKPPFLLVSLGDDEVLEEKKGTYMQDYYDIIEIFLGYVPSSLDGADGMRITEDVRRDLIACLANDVFENRKIVYNGMSFHSVAERQTYTKFSFRVRRTITEAEAYNLTLTDEYLKSSINATVAEDLIDQRIV